MGEEKMNDKKETNPIGCFWILTVMIATAASVTMFTLRITNQISLSFWIVFAPLIVVIGIPVLILAVGCIVILIGKAAGDE
jgi:hypothetical protein